MNELSRRRLVRGFGVLAIASADLAVRRASARATPSAANVVTVSLWDRGGNSMRMLGREPMRGMMMPGYGMRGRMMGISATPAMVKAGEVVFEVTNTSTVMIHEMVVAPSPVPSGPLPYIVDQQRVDEEKSRHLGEVAELEPGKSGAIRLTLKPGKYVLYCNIPGHYAVGMWTELTVEA